MRALSTLRFAVVGAAALVAIAAFVPSCTRTKDVTFVLKLPPDVKDQVAWLEVGVYAAPTCPSITQLSGGLPRGALVGRVGFANGSPAPTFRLDKGTYSFAATARNTQCEVLGAGCTAIDVPGSSEITIDLKAPATKGGKCSPGSACNNAECVEAPTSDGLGVGCTLEVVGAGPLEALSTDGSNVSRPAIQAVTDGFIIAYSQIDGTTYRVTTMKVGVDGGPVRADENTSLPFNRYTIPGACGDDAKTEGLGLEFEQVTSGNGLLVVPRSPKCTSAAMEIFTIAPNAHLNTTQPASPVFNGSADTHIMSNHPISAGGYLTSVINDQALLNVATSAGFGDREAVKVGGTPPHQRSWVAATKDALAVLTQAKGSSTPDPPPDDDGGGGGTGPAAGDTSEMRLEVASLKDGQSQLQMAPLLHGRFGSLAMQGARVVVVTSGSLQAPVDAHFLNVGDQAFQDLSLPSDEQGDTLAADVTVAGDRLYIATVQSLGVTVLAYDKFSSTPTLLKSKPLSRDFRVKQFMGGIFDTLRDGYVAVAANGARVGVVWMTGGRVQAGEEVGGWAVLACR